MSLPANLVDIVVSLQALRSLGQRHLKILRRTFVAMFFLTFLKKITTSSIYPEGSKYQESRSFKVHEGSKNRDKVETSQRTLTLMRPHSNYVCVYVLVRSSYEDYWTSIHFSRYQVLSNRKNTHTLTPV